MFRGELPRRQPPAQVKRITTGKTSRRLWAAIAASAAYAGTAFAQSATPQVTAPTREDIDAASRTPTLEPRAVPSIPAIEAQDCPFSGKGVVTLTQVKVTGATLLPGEQIQGAVADLLGRESDLGVLCEIRDRVAQLYAQRGEVLARVDLPEQRISGGVLTLAVTEGRIVDTAIRNPQAIGPAAGLASRYLDGLSGASAVRWSDLQRAFLLTREIPGADVGFSIRRAGDGSPNGLEAIAAFAPRRLFDLSLNGHNLGSRELGRGGLTVRLDANSFTPLGERTTIVGAISSNGGQRVVQLIEEVRVGSSGAVAFGDLAYSQSKPEGALKALELDGRAWIGRLGGRYPLVRSRRVSTDVSARFEYIDQKNDLGFIPGNPIPLFKDELRVLAAQLLNRWQPLSDSGLAVSTELELRKGLQAFGASERGSLLLSRGDSRPDFFLARVGAAARFTLQKSNRLRPWVSAAVSGQWSAHGLPAYEEYQIGNYTVGRGYDPGAASGDSGLGLQLEAGVDTPIPTAPFLGGSGSAGVFGFLDLAKVWNHDSLSYDSDISSVGGGLRIRWPRTQLSLLYASPQSAPFPSAARPDGRLLINLSRTFSIR